MDILSNLHTLDPRKITNKITKLIEKKNYFSFQKNMIVQKYQRMYNGARPPAGQEGHALPLI